MRRLRTDFEAGHGLLESHRALEMMLHESDEALQGERDGGGRWAWDKSSS